MEMFDKIVCLGGAVTTVICVALCIVLFFAVKSKDSDGNRNELSSKTHEKAWKLSTWIAGVFVAGTGVALMYAPSDLLGYVREGLTPAESITMVALLNGAPVWAMYSVMGLWYMKHMDSNIGKLAAMLSTVLGMAVSLWTGMNTIVRFVGLSFPGFTFMLAAVTVIIAMTSAKFNLLKGMSKAAFFVFIYAFLVLISTPLTDFKLTAISGSITGKFWTEYFFGDTTASWIFWFLSWSPTVARWLAHISKGRTMKEYIAGTMILPTVIAFGWMAVSWMYQDVIMNFNLAQNIAVFIPCVIFILSGLLFMAGTLDSDCKVFSEDMEALSGGRIKRNSVIPYYGIFVLFLFCFFNSGIISKPFAFNKYSALIFIPLIIMSIKECLKIVKNK